MAYRPLGFGGGFGGGFGRIGGGGSPGFSLNPSPQRGQGAYGMVPGAVGVPPSRYEQVGGVLNTRAAQPLISENLLRDLSGDIDIESLQNEAARFGVSTGMPMTGGGGPGFTGVRGLNRTEQELRNIRRQGLQDYLSAIQGVGALQTDPNLAAQLATQNAVWASAPNPQAAAEEQMRLWQRQFDQLSRGAGGGGGTRLNWANMGPQTPAFSAGGGPSGRVTNFFGERTEPFATYPALGAYGMIGPEGSGFAAADRFEFQGVAPWQVNPFEDYTLSEDYYDYNLPTNAESEMG